MDEQNIALLHTINGMLTAWTKKVDGDIEEIKTALKKNPSRKDFMDIQMRIDNIEEKQIELEKRIADKERAFGILETLKKHWKFLSFLICVVTSVGWGTHSVAQDIHRIAVSHYIPYSR